MSKKVITIWKPIAFRDFWLNTDTSLCYDIVISIHHFGYFDSIVAIGAFIEFIDKTYANRIEQTIPLNIKHYTISLEKMISERTKVNIKDYLTDVIRIGLSIIINEMN